MWKCMYVSSASFRVIQLINKEAPKVRVSFILLWESTGDRWNPTQRDGNTENIYI